MTSPPKPTTPYCYHNGTIFFDFAFSFAGNPTQLAAIEENFNSIVGVENKPVFKKHDGWASGKIKIDDIEKRLIVGMNTYKMLKSKNQKFSIMDWCYKHANLSADVSAEEIKRIKTYQTWRNQFEPILAAPIPAAPIPVAPIPVVPSTNSANSKYTRIPNVNGIKFVNLPAPAITSITAPQTPTPAALTQIYTQNVGDTFAPKQENLIITQKQEIETAPAQDTNPLYSTNNEDDDDIPLSQDPLVKALDKLLLVKNAESDALAAIQRISQLAGSKALTPAAITALKYIAENPEGLTNIGNMLSNDGPEKKKRRLQ